MPVGLASVFVTLVTAYVGAGVVFALAFVSAGVGRVDPRAADAGWGFRALILPGAALLWPFLAVRWRRAAKAGV